MRQRIPIHCIAGRVWFDTESGARFYDEVKSNFPLGIKHIKLWTWSSLSDPSWIYSITYDSDEGVISKEISLISGDTKELDICIYATQDIIHYKPERMLFWDQQLPAWTHVLNEYPSEIFGKSPSESEVPFGMYRHELQKYPDRHPLRMVWKAARR